MKIWVASQRTFPTVPLVEATKGLARGKLCLCWAQWIFSIFLFAGCGDHSSSSESAAKEAEQKASALQRWRESRAVARSQESEPTVATTSQTNMVDRVKAKQSLDSFSSRLKDIAGEAIPSDSDIAKKAENGDAASQAALAAQFMNNGDFEAALKWNRKAAEQGNVRAEHALGVMYVFGQGTENDYAEAVKWFKKAAEQGDVDSQYSLGVRYAKGDHVERNFAEAVKWFTLAANQGQPDAQVSLARRYANGEGVNKDMAEAYKWVVAAGDYWSATQYGEELKDKLTPEQIVEGKKRADQFKPVKTNVQ